MWCHFCAFCTAWFINHPFKVIHLDETFCFKLVWLIKYSNSSELLINHLKCFQFWLQICRDIQIFVHSAYYPNTLKCIQRIIRMCYISCHVLSAYGQFHSSYYMQTQIMHILTMRWISFCILSLHAKFHSTYVYYMLFHSGYYQNTENFVPCIISKCQVFPELKHSFQLFYVYTNFIPHIIHMR